MSFGAGLPDTSLGATVEVSEIESLVKGELIVGDGSGSPSKLTVGADGCVLAALASEATGVRWATELKVSATAVTATVPYVFANGSSLSDKALSSFRFGPVDAAAPVAQTLTVQGVVAGTSNIGGANWTFDLSQSTGSAAGGS